MIVFCDGFENFDIGDIYRKWNFFQVPSTWDSVNLKNVTDAAIVTGYDPLIPSSPVSRKGGRSLFTPKGDTYMGVAFRKSRTVFLGLALRVKETTTLEIFFSSAIMPQRVGNGLAANNAFTRLNDGNLGGPWAFPSDQLFSFTGPCERLNLYTAQDTTSYVGRSTWQGRSCICKCTLTIERTRASFKFEFADGIPAQYGYVNHNADAFAGSFYYYQLGFTTLGNNPVAGNSSWVEGRIGNRLDKRYFMSCETCKPDKETNYYVNGVHIHAVAGNSGMHVDDLYIANDEGDVNNDFLGAIFVRNMTVESQGTVNDAVPVNVSTGNRGDAVKGNLVRETTVSSWSGKTNDQAIQAAPVRPFDSSLLFERESDEQRFSLTPINFNGALPNIKGVVVNAIVEGLYTDIAPATLSVAICPGAGAPAFARTPLRSIISNHVVIDDYGSHPRTYGNELRQFFIENIDDIHANALNPAYLNNCEFSFRLDRYIENSAWFPTRKREKLIFDEIVSDRAVFFDDPSRYIEEVIYDTFSPTALSDAQWGRTIVEDLIFFDSTIEFQAYQHVIQDTFKAADDYLDFQQFTFDVVSFSDDVAIAYNIIVSDNVGLIDTSYGFWVEELMSSVNMLVTFTAIDSIFTAHDTIEFSVSDLWDNHLDAEESLVIVSSDAWDNHFDAETFLHLEENSVAAILELIEEYFEFEEDNFGGYWVEEWREQLGVVDSVLTQQWRHEWFMGVIINSWQINPIEQPGNDGSRIGTTDPEIFGA